MLFVWMQDSKFTPDWQKIKKQAAASALYAKTSTTVGIYVEVGNAANYEKVQYFEIDPPKVRTMDNAHIFAAAERIGRRMSRAGALQANYGSEQLFTGKIGRNERCPCGSGLKYKRCHGR